MWKYIKQKWINEVKQVGRQAAGRQNNDLRGLADQLEYIVNQPDGIN